ncbi:UPF0182 family protein [Wukongibacter baidiensis]|uniref:UPF0182 family membrane protein n=1 Tax=Wukongibacter baidiensis TaxID=1723361 RepID=UPI003D7F9AD0
MKSARKLIMGIIVVVALILITSFNTIISFITDYEWFNELGFDKVFLTKLMTQLKIGIPLFIVIILFTYLYLISIKKDYYRKVNVVYQGVEEKRINQMAFAGSLFVGFISSISASKNLWFDILRFTNSTGFNISDPIFNKDVSFYIFKYPLFQKLYFALTSFIVLIAVLTVVFYGAMMTLRRPVSVDNNEEIDIPNIRHINIDDVSKILDIAARQLIVIGFIFFTVLGLGYYLRTYELLYSTRGVVYGASYTDIKVTLLKYRIMMILSLISAFILVFGIKTRKLKLAVTGPVLMIAVSLLGNVATGLVQNYIVSPDEISKEKQFIEHNIAFTQKGYGLEAVAEKEFPALENLTKEDLEKNQDTLTNVRINDYRPSELVYNQKQGIRYYYNFNDVDVDRYYVDGKYRQVFISARELDQTKIREEVLTFINRQLKYTHGYGVVMSPVNKITTEGLPYMLIENIPPATEIEGFEIQRPEIYFGELTNDYVIVNTKEKEFDYPKGSSNVESTYGGSGGIKLNGINKLLFAYEQKSLKMLLSGNITSESRILLNRNINERIRKIMPYIQYDSDPYIVLSEGKLYWIIDGYTTSGNYPYSEPLSNSGINYIRNSVKVVIDAYNGKATYYVSDEKDPLINTYRKIFPQLFTAIENMPEDLKAHIRYPRVLFDIQSQIYRVYHMEDPQVFYNQEDEWDIADELYQSEEQPMESNYLVMKLPEEKNEEFVLTIPYTPKDKKNMTALFVGRNDKENYGQLVVYKLPKSKNIYGPMQIENKIDSDANISKELTLWSQKGSTVIRGNLLTVPIENSLLYVEPIYLKADSEDSLPEVKRVIVGYGEQIVMKPTFEEALEEIFGEVNEKQGLKSPQVETTIEDGDLKGLIIKAKDVFDRSLEAQKIGAWAEYGRLIDELKVILEKLNRLNNETINNIDLLDIGN